MDGELYNLAKTKSGYRSKRISSYDKNGYNGDRIVGIKPNEKVIICDIQGAGIINHIWFTIAPPPHLINRNDIILRIYWDGNDYPSVESPIGPFSDKAGMKVTISHRMRYPPDLQMEQVCLPIL